MCAFYHATYKPFNVGSHFSTNDFDGETTHDHANRTEQDKEINYHFCLTNTLFQAKCLAE